MLMMMRRPEFLMMRRPEFLMMRRPAPPQKSGSIGLYITTLCENEIKTLQLNKGELAMGLANQLELSPNKANLAHK
jgi:hypothetical protein